MSKIPSCRPNGLQREHMTFRKIDRTAWPRNEVFEHYFSKIPCTYSLTTKLDITNVRAKKLRLYPTMLHAITTVVNRHEEFRTAFNEAGELGVFSDMHPCYTVFHKESETFSNLWTEYTPDLKEFFRRYEADLAAYGDDPTFFAKPNLPKNSFTVSMLPWTTFDGFNLNLPKGSAYTLPIFTLGKFFLEGERTLLPVALQVHHAVCDGFHTCRFLNELQTLLDGIE